MTQQHICLDLETLSTKPNAAILSIGAVKFDVERGIYDTFYQNVMTGKLNVYSYEVSTMQWWLQQSQEARDSVQGNQVFLQEGLEKFLSWIGDTEKFLFWSMENFDAPIIQFALETEIGTEGKLPFRNFRDYRTIKDLLKLEYPPFEGIKHNALDDARNEALLIIEGLKKLQ